jgi:divalent metal cation (Fe/Co/Zn/Cd) transporter
MLESQPHTHIDIAIADREKRGVAFWSLMAAILLTTTKILVGVWTNSLGILAEAAHSALDLVAAAMTLWAVRMSSVPADPEHPYGHGKFENLSALFETLLLLERAFGSSTRRAAGCSSAWRRKWIQALGPLR